MQRAWHDWFRRERRKAKRLIEDPTAVVRAVARADRKAERIGGARGPLARVWDDLQTTVRLVRAWGRRDYRDVGRGTIVLLVGALLYFLCPIDAIVDAVPVLGYVDDAAVLAWVIGQVRAELDAFRTWERIEADEAQTDEARLGTAASSPARSAALPAFASPSDADPID